MQLESGDACLLLYNKVPYLITFSLEFSPGGFSGCQTALDGSGVLEISLRKVLFV